MALLLQNCIPSCMDANKPAGIPENPAELTLMGEPWRRVKRSWKVQTRVTKPKPIEDPPFTIPWEKVKMPYIVQTESEVKIEAAKIPDPCCVCCRGSGKLTCERCRGRGRTNNLDFAKLPKGVWPRWCWYCRGSGLAMCARCLGTGEKRGVIGFHLAAMEEPTKPSGLHR